MLKNLAVILIVLLPVFVCKKHKEMYKFLSKEGFGLESEQQMKGDVIEQSVTQNLDMTSAPQSRINDDEVSKVSFILDWSSGYSLTRVDSTEYKIKDTVKIKNSKQRRNYTHFCKLLVLLGFLSIDISAVVYELYKEFLTLQASVLIYFSSDQVQLATALSASPWFIKRNRARKQEVWKGLKKLTRLTAMYQKHKKVYGSGWAEQRSWVQKERRITWKYNMCLKEKWFTRLQKAPVLAATNLLRTPFRAQCIRYQRKKRFETEQERVTTTQVKPIKLEDQKTAFFLTADRYIPVSRGTQVRQDALQTLFQHPAVKIKKEEELEEKTIVKKERFARLYRDAERSVDANGTAALIRLIGEDAKYFDIVSERKETTLPQQLLVEVSKRGGVVTGRAQNRLIEQRAALRKTALKLLNNLGSLARCGLQKSKKKWSKSQDVLTRLRKHCKSSADFTNKVRVENLLHTEWKTRELLHDTEVFFNSLGNENLHKLNIMAGHSIFNRPQVFSCKDTKRTPQTHLRARMFILMRNSARRSPLRVSTYRHTVRTRLKREYTRLLHLLVRTTRTHKQIARRAEYKKYMRRVVRRAWLAEYRTELVRLEFELAVLLQINRARSINHRHAHKAQTFTTLRQGVTKKATKLRNQIAALNRIPALVECTALFKDLEIRVVKQARQIFESCVTKRKLLSKQAKVALYKFAYTSVKTLLKKKLTTPSFRYTVLKKFPRKLFHFSSGYQRILGGFPSFVKYWPKRKSFLKTEAVQIFNSSHTLLMKAFVTAHAKHTAEQIYRNFATHGYEEKSPLQIKTVRSSAFYKILGSIKELSLTYLRRYKLLSMVRATNVLKVRASIADSSKASRLHAHPLARMQQKWKGYSFAGQTWYLLTPGLPKAYSFWRNSIKAARYRNSTHFIERVFKYIKQRSALYKDRIINTEIVPNDSKIQQLLVQQNESTDLKKKRTWTIKELQSRKRSLEKQTRLSKIRQSSSNKIELFLNARPVTPQTAPKFIKFLDKLALKHAFRRRAAPRNWARRPDHKNKLQQSTDKQKHLEKRADNFVKNSNISRFILSLGRGKTRYKSFASLSKEKHSRIHCKLTKIRKAVRYRAAYEKKKAAFAARTTKARRAKKYIKLENGLRSPLSNLKRYLQLRLTALRKGIDSTRKVLNNQLTAGDIRLSQPRRINYLHLKTQHGQSKQSKRHYNNKSRPFGWYKRLKWGVRVKYKHWLKKIYRYSRTKLGQHSKLSARIEESHGSLGVESHYGLKITRLHTRNLWKRTHRRLFFRRRVRRLSESQQRGLTVVEGAERVETKSALRDLDEVNDYMRLQQDLRMKKEIFGLVDDDILSASTEERISLSDRINHGFTLAEEELTQLRLQRTKLVTGFANLQTARRFASPSAILRFNTRAVVENCGASTTVLHQQNTIQDNSKYFTCGQPVNGDATENVVTVAQVRQRFSTGRSEIGRLFDKTQPTRAGIAMCTALLQQKMVRTEKFLEYTNTVFPQTFVTVTAPAVAAFSVGWQKKQLMLGVLKGLGGLRAKLGQPHRHFSTDAVKKAGASTTMLRVKNSPFNNKIVSVYLKVQRFDIVSNLLKRAAVWTKQNLQKVRDAFVNTRKVATYICAVLAVAQYSDHNLITESTFIAIAAVALFSVEQVALKQAEPALKKEVLYKIEKTRRVVGSKESQHVTKLKIIAKRKSAGKVTARLRKRFKHVTTQLQPTKRSSNTAFIIKKRKLLTHSSLRFRKKAVTVVWNTHRHQVIKAYRRIRSALRVAREKAFATTPLWKAARVKGYRFKKKSRRSTRSIALRYYRGYKLLLKLPADIKSAFRRSWHQLQQLRSVSGLSDTHDMRRVQKQMMLTRKERRILKKNRTRDARHGAWQTHWNHVYSKYLYGYRTLNPTKRKHLVCGDALQNQKLHSRKFAIRWICEYVFTNGQLPQLTEKTRQQAAWMLPDLAAAATKVQVKWKQIQNYYSKLPYWILHTVRKNMKADFMRASRQACRKMSRKLEEQQKVRACEKQRKKNYKTEYAVTARSLALLRNLPRRLKSQSYIEPRSLLKLHTQHKRIKSIRGTVQQRPSNSQEITREAAVFVLADAAVTPEHQASKIVKTLTLSSSYAALGATALPRSSFGDSFTVEENVRSVQNSTEDFRHFLEQSTTLLAYEYATFPDFRDSFLGGEDRAWFALWSDTEFAGLPSLTREEKIYATMLGRKSGATKDKSFWLAQAGDWWARRWNREMLDTEVEGNFERSVVTGVVEGESYRYLELTSAIFAASLGREERLQLSKVTNEHAVRSQEQFKNTLLLAQPANTHASSSGLARRQALLTQLQQLKGAWAKQRLYVSLRAAAQVVFTMSRRNWNERLRFAQHLLRQLTLQELESSAVIPRLHSAVFTVDWNMYYRVTEKAQLSYNLLSQQVRQLAHRTLITSKGGDFCYVGSTPLRQRQTEVARSTLLVELTRKYVERQQERGLLLSTTAGRDKITVKAMVRGVSNFTKTEDLATERRTLVNTRSRNFALRTRSAELLTATSQKKSTINFVQALQQEALSLLLGQTSKIETSQFASRVPHRLPNQRVSNIKELAQWGGSYLQARTQVPHTLQGMRSLLLPPAVVWAAEKRTQVGSITLENSSRPTRVNLQPTIIHLAPHDPRQNQVARQLQQRRLRLERREHSVSNALRKRRKHLAVYTQKVNTVVNQKEKNNSLRSVMQKRTKNVLCARPRKFSAPERVFMSTNTSSFETGRQFALRSVQSTLRMRKQEAILPAWTPHYPASYLQRVLQRQSGLSVVRGSEHRKMKDKHHDLQRAKPSQVKSVETDSLILTQKKEMFSAQSYARVRAVHTLKTSRGRWWKPLARPLPFVNTLYRRPGMNWNYQQINYTRPGAARPGDLTYFTPGKEMLFFSKSQTRLSKKKEHLHNKEGTLLALWVPRLQKRITSASSGIARDLHRPLEFAARATRTVVRQTDHILRTRLQVLPRWVRAEELLENTKMVKLPQKYWETSRNDKHCQFIPHIEVSSEAIQAEMKKRKAPLAQIEKMRRHLLSIADERTFRRYQREYMKVFRSLQPRLEKTQRAATLAALTPLQREKLQSRFWPKDELSPNGAKLTLAPAISVGAETQLFGEPILEQYRPMFKYLLSDENMLFADSRNHRSLEEEAPVQEWTPEAYTEYLKWHVLKGNVPWLTENKLEEYRTRFEEETNALFTWRHSRDLPGTLHEVILKSKEQKIRSGDAVKSRRFLITSPRERRLLEASAVQRDAITIGEHLQYNQEAMERATTQLFTMAYRRLSNRLRAGFENKRAKFTAILFALFRQWVKLQSFSTVGPEFSSTVIEQTTTFLTQTLSYVQTENVSMRNKLEFERKLRVRLERFWKTRRLSQIQQKSETVLNNFLHPDNSVIHREWLLNTARYLNRTQTIFTATTYGPKEVPVSVNFERPRARFIGAGREAGGYEAFLHAFVRQTASSRFRRVSSLRFFAVSSESSEDYQQNLFTNEQTRSARRRRRFARKLSQIAYLSRTWRELFTLRANASVGVNTTQKNEQAVTNTTFPHQYGEPFQGGVKRRFASLPIQLIFDEKRENALVGRSKLLVPNRAQSAEVLRQALEERANELDFLNFQQAAGARRLPDDMPMTEREHAEELEDATDDKRVAFLSAWEGGELEEREAEVRFWGFTEYEGVALSAQDLVSTNLTTYQDELFTFIEETPNREEWASESFNTLLTGSAEISSDRPEKRRFIKSDTEEEIHELELINAAVTSEAVLTTSEQRARRDARRAAFSKRRGMFLTKRDECFKKNSLHYIEKTARRLLHSRVSALSKNKLGVITSRALSLRSRKKSSANYSRNRYRRRYFAATKRAERFVPATNNGAIATYQNVNRLIKQFVRNPFTSSKILPLIFEAKLDDYIDPEVNTINGNEAIKSDFYKEEIKLTAQYMETVGLYLPRLISLLITRRVKREKLTFTQVKGIVLATYWSVRIYLSTDDLGTTLKATDKHYFRLQRNKKIVTNLAEDQDYSRISRYTLRQRLQPAEVLSVPNSTDFNGDWLRWAFPTHHELYQEDARKYGKMLITLRHIAQIVPNITGVANSRTKNGTTSIDRRAFYLYTLPRVRSNPQFETMLRTVRREVPEFSATEYAVKENEQWLMNNMPWIDLYRARSRAVLARKPSRQKRLGAQHLGKTITRRWLTRGTPSLFENFRHLQISSKLATTVLKVFNLSTFARLNFFARSAHTATARTFGHIASLINRRSRTLRDATYEHSNYEKLVARAYIKEHAVFRNATGYVTGIDDGLESGSFGALPADYLRQKSPRSRQYLVRHIYGAKIYREALLQQYAQYRRLAEEVTAKPVLVRSERKGLDYSCAPVEQSEKVDLTALNRKETPIRRLLSVLRAPKREAVDKRAREQEYNFPNRSQTSFHSPFMKRTVATAKKWKGRLRTLFSTTKKQILQAFCRMEGHAFTFMTRFAFRRASMRITTISAPRESLLASNNIGVQKSTSTRVQRKLREGWVGAWLNRRLQRICKISLLKKEESLGWLLHLVQIIRTRAASAWKKFTSYLPGPRKSKKLETENTATVNCESLQLLEEKKSAAAVKEFTYFTNETFALIRAEEERLEEIIFLENEAAGDTNFDHSREELFNSLTSLVSKKLRRARHWLRFFKRSIKDSWLHGMINFYIDSAEEFGWSSIQESRAKFMETLSAEKSMSVEDKEKRKWAQHRAITKREAIAKKPPVMLIPAGVFTEATTIKRRLYDVKQMTWKERSDTFYRSWQKYNRALYGAFAFANEEKLRIRWLEGELFNRAIYSTNHGELRRYHTPSEQKRFKRGHLVRRHLYAVRNRNVLMKRKRRHQMRRMNMRLHLELFGLRNTRAANKVFKKLRRQTRPKGGAFTRLQKGLMTRLSCVLMQLNLAPTAWWSRTIARYGVVRVNGKIICSPSYQVRRNDLIAVDYVRLAKYKHWLTPPQEDAEEIGLGGERWSLTSHAENIISNRGTDLFLYRGPATEEELTSSGRLRAELFRAAVLDSNKMSRRTFCTSRPSRHVEVGIFFSFNKSTWLNMLLQLTGPSAGFRRYAAEHTQASTSRLQLVFRREGREYLLCWQGAAIWLRLLVIIFLLLLFYVLYTRYCVSSTADITAINTTEGEHTEKPFSLEKGHELHDGADSGQEGRVRRQPTTEYGEEQYQRDPTIRDRAVKSPFNSSTKKRYTWSSTMEKLHSREKQWRTELHQQVNTERSAYNVSANSGRGAASEVPKSSADVSDWKSAISVKIPAPDELTSWGKKRWSQINQLGRADLDYIEQHSQLRRFAQNLKEKELAWCESSNTNYWGHDICRTRGELISMINAYKRNNR